MTLYALKHPNLLRYHNMKYQQSPGKIDLQVLSEFAGGGSLVRSLRSNQPVPVEVIQLYGRQIVAALSYLHNKAVTHKDLRASSILLDNTGHVKMADYSVGKKIKELYSSVKLVQPSVHFETEQIPTLGKSGKKADVYRLGILLLSLVEGKPVVELLPVIPSNIPSDLHDFLTKCLLKDERHRWSAQDLLDHTFLKTPLHIQPSNIRASSQEKQLGGENNADIASPEEDSTELIPFIPSSESGQSRLQNEFDILKWLGTGGFGDVIKVILKITLLG